MVREDDAPSARVIGSVLAVQGAFVTAQLLDRAFTGPTPIVIGELVVMPAGGHQVYGIVHSLRKGRRLDDKPIIDIQLLGETIRQKSRAALFRRGISNYPALDVVVSRATREETAIVYAQPAAAHVPIGSLRHDPALPAFLITDALLGRHFAILGSTGSGKSCAVTVVLNALLDAYPYAHVLVIDPHNEYGPAFGERAIRLEPSNLELPYWLMTFEEISAILTSGTDARGYAEGAILRDAIIRAKQLYLNGDPEAAHVTVDTPVPYRLSDLYKMIEDAMGALGKPEGATAYRHLLARLASVRDDRRYGFMFQSLYLRDNMDTILSKLLRLPVDGRPVTLLDISGVPSEVVNVVVSLLCRLIFEFGLWSERHLSTPLLLVCEEAHRYVPGDGVPVFEPSRRAIDRIAKEGRKYGVSLCLVSQRPAELSSSSLSQCGTIFALRMSNERDQAFVRNVLPDGSDWLIRSLPALGTGEAVVVGEGVTVPMQIHFKELPPEAQPASQTPPFSKAWAQDVTRPGTIAQVVSRWRCQRR